MTGTLAIWHEAFRGSEGTTAGPGVPPPPEHQPEVELHFNLWRDSTLRADFIDIGIRVSAPHKFNRLMLYVPTQVREEQVLDLSPVLRHDTSLNAVFNDLVEIRDRAREHFDIQFGGKTVRVHSIKIGENVSLDPVVIDPHDVGTVLVFERGLVSLFGDAQAHYVRFRIYLTEANHDLFSSEVIPSDWFLAPSFQNTETTEFRLNERRTIPASMIGWFEMGPVRITTVHYFLIRNLRHELMVQHRDFRKIRTLEPRLWAHYLSGRHPTGRGDLEPYPGLAEPRFVIYHWKEQGKRDDNGKFTRFVQEFNAYAKFRMHRSNLLTYVYAATMIGGLGSAAYGIVFAAYQWAKQAVGLSPPPGESLSVTAAVVDAVLVAFLICVVLSIFSLVAGRPGRLRGIVTGWLHRIVGRHRTPGH